MTSSANTLLPRLIRIVLFLFLAVPLLSSLSVQASADSPLSQEPLPPVLGKALAAPVWREFWNICGFPRLSTHEEALRSYILDRARVRGLHTEVDAVGNVQVSLPACPGFEKAPRTILHAHLDMVGDKIPGCVHDFSRDPIRPLVSGNWVTAKETTLGADNGIGVALLLAILDAPPMPHGPLQFLFTVDEEGGFTGADGVSERWLTAPSLINLDSEENHEINIGCAGGVTHKMVIPAPRQAPAQDAAPYLLQVSGLTGGHSGVDIHHGRANAIKLLARALRPLLETREVELATIEAGTFDTTIPREAQAQLWVRPDVLGRVRVLTDSLKRRLPREVAKTDPGTVLSLSPASFTRKLGCMNTSLALSLVQLLSELPQGPIVWSREFPGHVETSANPGVILTATDSCTITSHLQSSSERVIAFLACHIARLADPLNAQCYEEVPYRPWASKSDSPLRSLVGKTHKTLFGFAPKEKVVHAGIECGSFAAKNPPLDMISFGPNIAGAHTPGERVEISSVDDTWRLLRQVLVNLTRGE